MRERWVPVKGYEEFYEVSDRGRVRSLDRIARGRSGGLRVVRGRVRRPGTWLNGYRYIQLRDDSGTQFTTGISRLVAIHFVSNPHRLSEVNHKDLDKTNNVYSNLKWTTRKGNCHHAGKRGRYTATENPSRAKRLTLAEVRMIRKLYRPERGMLAALSRKFGVHYVTIRAIVSDQTWSGYHASQQ